MKACYLWQRIAGQPVLLYQRISRVTASSARRLNLAGAELRFGISDARGLQADSKVVVNGTSLELQPGKGLAASGGSGFFTFVDWDAASPMEVTYNYAIRGNKTLTMVPRGGDTKWDVKSSWPSTQLCRGFST